MPATWVLASKLAAPSGVAKPSPNATLPGFPREEVRGKPVWKNADMLRLWQVAAYEKKETQHATES